VGGEVLPGVSSRRVWSTEENLRILAQSVAPGSSPTLTCRMHGISSGQFYTWRKQFRSGELTGFMPVSIALEPPALLAPALVEAPAATPAVGIVEVELPSGVKLRV
jgi:transposase